MFLVLEGVLTSSTSPEGTAILFDNSLGRHFQSQAQFVATLVEILSIDESGEGDSDS